VDFTADDEEANFVCQLDDRVPVACEDPHTFTKLGTGEYVVGVRATDEAGNQGNEAETTAYVSEG
jgi:hypothetical protein